MVEFVEALTIVVAVGVTINWKSSLLGAAAAFLALAALVAAFGTALTSYATPDRILPVLRTVVGIILILFGLQWLKKSLLRYSGLKAIHDEAAIYENRMLELKAKGGIDQKRFNGFGFVTSLKSVLLEGTEVVFIVITFGFGAGAEKGVGIFSAAIGALLAFVVVTLLGITIQKPLTKLPENTLKFTVGIMLVTFGTFWSGEGIGVSWPMGDLFLLALVAYYLLASFLLVRWLKKYTGKERKAPVASGKKPVTNPVLQALKSIFDFFCGDWRVFWSVAALIAAVALALHFAAVSWLPAAACAVYMLGVVASIRFALGKETK